jgi:hypothetical protein
MRLPVYPKSGPPRLGLHCIAQTTRSLRRRGHTTISDRCTRSLALPGPHLYFRYRKSLAVGHGDIDPHEVRFRRRLTSVGWRVFPCKRSVVPTIVSRSGTGKA